MASYRSSRIITIVLGVLLTVVAILVAVFVIRAVFFGSSSPEVNVGKEALVHTAADRSVQMDVRGNIVADEDFRSYQIQVSSSQRIFNLNQGYQNQTIKNISLDNNFPAYEQFVYALDEYGLMNANELTGVQNDTRGVCPDGSLYTFQVFRAGKTVRKLWTTTCSNARGSLSVSVNRIIDLFTDQVPGASPEISRIR